MCKNEGREVVSISLIGKCLSVIIAALLGLLFCITDCYLKKSAKSQDIQSGNLLPRKSFPAGVSSQKKKQDFFLCLASYAGGDDRAAAF
jgi:hypothetical protein